MGRSHRWWCAWALVTLAGTLPVGAQSPPLPEDADQPTVALPHLNRVNGDGAVVQRDVDEVEAVAGEHLAFGDRVTTDGAQVQILWSDGSSIALDRETSVAVLSPELLALTAGRLLVVTPADAAQALRIDTPAGTLLVRPGSDARVTLDEAIADLKVAHGAVDVRHPEATLTVSAGQQIALRDGAAPGATRVFNTAAFDSFIAWAREPVVAAERSASRAYLGDPRLEAYGDVFDRYGEWDQDPTYGQVWFPTVGADWRPYSQGYWQPFGGAYGPTWVAQDPWGWPTHHYGAWGVGNSGRWFWQPGRQWSPGRVNWTVGPGYVGWSPRGLRADTGWGWSRIVTPPRASQRGVYPAGTLDPLRAWTIVPSERYGLRGGLSSYAVDGRTLGNLDAFVTPRLAPPVRYGVPRGTSRVMTVPPGSSYPGRAAGRAGYGARTGSDTTVELRRGIPPTRVAPASPGPATGPTPPPDDPYERAGRVMAPRGRQRTPPPAEAEAEPREPAPRPPAAGRAPTSAPQRREPTSAPQRSAPPPPPPSAAPAEAPPQAPPARGLETRRPTSRQASPRPPA